MAKILNFGSLNIDYVYSLDHFVKPGETTSSSKLEQFCGGKGLNQSIALSKSGAKVYHAGAVGKNGDVLLNALKEADVNTEFTEKLDVDDGHAIIQVDSNGENCIILFEGSNGCISKEQIEKTIENFDNGDFLVLQNEINNIDYIIKTAHAKGMKIVLNPSPMNDAIFNLPLEYVDYFVLNEIEAKAILNVDSEDNLLENLSEKYPKSHIVLTLGGDGSSYKFKDEVCTQDIFETTVVDTTAAGDTFLGYFISQVANGVTAKAGLEIAAKAASIAISIKGAANSIPTIEQVEK